MRVLPIREVRVVPDARTLLLADFASLSAFGSDGQLWKHRVCWDDLKIQDIREGIVRGVGYDPTNRKPSTSKFAVKLVTGRVWYLPGVSAWWTPYTSIWICSFRVRSSELVGKSFQIKKSSETSSWH
jgi:hypothetical protein